MRALMLRSRGLVWFVLLVVFTEVGGRSVTSSVDRRLHLSPLAPSHASYYPFLLVAVKVIGALALAALLARLVRLRATAEAGDRLFEGLGLIAERRLPRLRLAFSLRAWLGSFVATSIAYLVQTNGEGMSRHHLPSLAPWLHTYALPVFAVLSVFVALVWRVGRWLDDVEEHAHRTLARARRMLGTALRPVARPGRPTDDRAPRRRFGSSLSSRPPPLAA